MTYILEYLDDDYVVPDYVLADYPYDVYQLMQIYKCNAQEIIRLGFVCQEYMWNPSNTLNGLRNVRFKKKFLKHLERFYNKYPVQR